MKNFLISNRLFPPSSFDAPGSGENSMHKPDGFPRAVAFALSIAFAFAVSLLAAFAFGGLP